MDGSSRWDAAEFNRERLTSSGERGVVGGCEIDTQQRQDRPQEAFRWRKGNRKTRRSVNAVSIAQFENVFGAPGRPDGDGRHAPWRRQRATASRPLAGPRPARTLTHSPRDPSSCTSGWTFDLMSRSCTRSGHRGQRAYSCLVAAEGLCTNAAVLRQRREPTSPGEILREEFSPAARHDAKTAGQASPLRRQSVNRLVNGRTSVARRWR